MKTITIKNLTIQVDIPKAHGNMVADAQTALDLINLALQNEPSGLGAQILFSSIDASDIEIDGASFINGDLTNDFEKIEGYDVLEIRKDEFESDDTTNRYTIEVNDQSYLYDNVFDRDDDYKKLKKLFSK